MEWWTAVAKGEAAEAFLGTQGDPWDTQWDMFMALIGATASVLLLGRMHDRVHGVVDRGRQRRGRRGLPRHAGRSVGYAVGHVHGADRRHGLGPAARPDARPSSWSGGPRSPKARPPRPSSARRAIRGIRSGTCSWR